MWALSAGKTGERGLDSQQVMSSDVLHVNALLFRIRFEEAIQSEAHEPMWKTMKVEDIGW